MRYYIKPYLKEKGFNLKVLAKRLELNYQSFYYNLSKKENISLTLARQLSEIIGEPLEEFIKNVEVKEETE